MTEYASARAKILHWYCKKCLKEKQEREYFSDTVCKIFGIKTPGPRIWTERKRLQDKYGYTDQIIIDCLIYLYEVKKIKTYAESLCLITPSTVEQMKQNKKKEQTNSWNLISAIQTNMTEYFAPIENKKQKAKIEYNLDDWIEDDINGTF